VELRRHLGEVLRRLAEQKESRIEEGHLLADLGANIENLEPEMALAIREMPAALSGMLETDRARLVDHALKVHHGDAVAELANLEAGIAIAEGAITACREEIARDVGGLPKFNAAAEPYEKALGVLWLRKEFDADKNEVAKVFRQLSAKEGRWKNAAPEDIEADGYFQTYNEWVNAGGNSIAETQDAA
jgi:hypothetical protein